MFLQGEGERRVQDGNLKQEIISYGGGPIADPLAISSCVTAPTGPRLHLSLTIMMIVIMKQSFSKQHLFEAIIIAP
jgi:hypothetical protein